MNNILLYNKNKKTKLCYKYSISSRNEEEKE